MNQTLYSFPENMETLCKYERSFRQRALDIINMEPSLVLHLNVAERAMSVAKLVVSHPSQDEDFKVIKMLSIRMFNAFGASLLLMLSGYHQKNAMIMRDTLETVFLMDLFKRDYAAIKRWRFADRAAMRKEFSPAAVRKFLDDADGLTTRKREETYRMFSELAAHPNMHSQHMLRPKKGSDIVMGPFMEETTLEAGVSELGKLAVQAGEVMSCFLPLGWDQDGVRLSFEQIKRHWISEFYGQLSNKGVSGAE